MKREYDEFFNDNPKYGGYRANVSFLEMYQWLSEPHQVCDMMEASKYERPALEGVVYSLEEKFGNRTDLNLTDNFVKQMIGTAVKHILLYFGYVQTIQKAMPKGRFFMSATHYKYDENASRKKTLILKPVVEQLQ
jgi:hypothetical protein